MGFFPATGFAWVVSNEPWMKSAENWLSLLKLRGSYGFVGNDGVIKNPRFLYLQSMAPVSQYGAQMGIDGKPTKQYNINNYGNPSTKWEISEQLNIGVETKLFNGFVDFIADAYQEIRHNIYDYRTSLPATLGLYMPPLDNVGKVRARGVDLQLKFQHAFSNDFYFIVNTNFSYNKAVYLELEEPEGLKSWQQRKGTDNISATWLYS